MKKSLLLFILLPIILISCTPDCNQDAPVCGKIQVQCVTTPCDPVEETFQNECIAKERGAFEIKEGACITNFEECVKAGNPVMESYPRQCRADGETFVEEIYEIEEIKLETPENLVNSKNTQERIQESYDKLHALGSAQHIRDNFPDIELVFVDNPEDAYYPKEILPFKYYYSKEADKTFNLCAIERTVFICDGKFEQAVTDEDLNSNKCIVTPVYQIN